MYLKNKEDVKNELLKIAHSAIDNHIIQSWYYNGDSFVIIFKKNNEVKNDKQK